MAVLQTTMFGALEYQPEQLISLAAPLPGLPDTRWLLPVSQKVMAPFVFFQSLEEPSLCLLATPVRVVREDYLIQLSGEDRALLRLSTDGRESAGRESSELGAFAFVTVSEDEGATANLLAPLVIHLPANLAMQAIQPLGEEFLRYPLDIPISGVEGC
ncbi:MAG: flagellar assembly protein FliW [Bryobacterales bacterium]|jgi:flagellar assembly factor FliW|nr:flagellar assembly protein FliW [Bryobacterales bacterium]